jgi:hypothetical protein
MDQQQKNAKDAETAEGTLANTALTFAEDASVKLRQNLASRNSVKVEK